MNIRCANHEYTQPRCACHRRVRRYRRLLCPHLAAKASTCYWSPVAKNGSASWRRNYRRHNIHCHIFAADLTDPKAPEATISYAQQQGLEIGVLINNAGLSGKDAFADRPWPALAANCR